MYTINCKGKLLQINKPLVMGIINATPDSFYEGNINSNMLAMADEMIAAGVDIIDIGGQSTKPNSKVISVDEELERVISLIDAIAKKYPSTVLSIDTYYSEVAKAAIVAGASIVNDVSAGNMDKNMLPTIADLRVPVICMHMQGTPQTMQQNPTYKNVTQEVLDFFIAKIDECKKAGIMDVIIDVGFGFGKTIEHNYTLLKNLSIFKMLQVLILAGLSRKSMIYKPLQTSVAAALNGTTALNTIALLNGANILRVHDVKEAIEVIKLIEQYQKA
jgi:dihydropteroate synthase